MVKKTAAKLTHLFGADVPLYVICVFAATGIPYILAYDLHPAVPTIFYALAAYLPFALWLVLAFGKRFRRPFVTFVLLGLIYGVLVAATRLITQSHLGLAGSAVSQVVAFVSWIVVGVCIGIGIGSLAVVAGYSRAPRAVAARKR